MKFNEEKKNNILLYILEKIEQGDMAISRSVSETFGVNQATIHTYLNELMERDIISKIKRGQYKLVEKEYVYSLKRSEGDLNTDTYAFDFCLSKHIENLPDNVQQIWNYTFSEMTNNVMDHSAAENMLIVVRQSYLKTKVLLSDDGVGIFKKIMEYFKLTSLEDAIGELFKGKLTTDSENHSGEGIFFSSKMMDDFFIVSSGKIFTNNKYDNSEIIDIAMGNLGGTCVIMGLSNFTHKNPKEVFDLYANDDGAFVKTKIPIKNIFDSSPVSRSQAKRVCNRLEKFKEVVIDFTDVPWMGQGFAHQLFGVFAKQHENIKLIPINMNEDVTKMYNHVITTV